MCTWKECAFCCLEVEHYRYHLSPSGLMCHLSHLAILIFCLDVQFIDVSVMWNYPTIIKLLLISPFLSVNICLIYLGAPVLVVYIFTIILSFSWIDPLIIMWCPSFFCNSLYFKAYFVWYEYCYSSILLISVVMEYLFPSPWGHLFSGEISSASQNHSLQWIFKQWDVGTRYYWVGLKSHNTEIPEKV